MSGPKKKKILLMTATGAYNLWDELILREEVNFLRSHYGNVEITIFTYDKKSSLIEGEDLHYVKYFPSGFFQNPIANIWYFFHNIITIWRADVLIIGGGGIIFDNEPGVSFGTLLWQWYFRIKTARIAGTTLLFWGISLEVNQIQNKMKLKQLFTPGDFILVRDEKSKWLLEALEIPSVQVQDVVFLYEPKKPTLPPPEKKLVGISVRGGFLGENEKYIPQIYDFLEEAGYQPIFLVFTTAGETEQNDSLFIKKVMTGKTYRTTKTIHQTLDIFPNLYTVVWMRFHAGILSCVHEIPYIPLSYGSKTDEFVRALEIEKYAIRPNELSFELFTTIWHNFIADYANEKDRITQKHTIFHDWLMKHLETL